MEKQKLVPKNNGLIIPEDYCPILDRRETQVAVTEIKDFYDKQLARELNLKKIRGPLFLAAETGINDDLTGAEKPVSFITPDINSDIEIVQAVTKWKRMALADYGFKHGEGLFVDMHAIRSHEKLTSLHSIFVDQWDWERVISREERTLAYLKEIVRRIYKVIKKTELYTYMNYRDITPILPEKIKFIHSEELLEKYPGTSAKQREDSACREYGAVFIIGIGAELKDGKPHDVRAPDYDDWTTPTIRDYKGLNGDILVWHPILKTALELTSMGIRVDKGILEKQLIITSAEHKKDLLWHKRLLKGEFPLTIGGGIGQSRHFMFYLRKAHIGEVHCGIWPDWMRKVCEEKRIQLL
ncbi:aspartate--ammonia ligase [Candidatus Woesearchaeota archaeon]|nr:aspartate--ammonia ligase [Candidatus Woesearchaeota archaeon]